MARQTSIAAYYAIRDTLAPGIRRMIYAVLCRKGNLTANQIHRRVNKRFGKHYDRPTVAPRLKEMIYCDLIEECGTKECPITGRLGIKYRVTGLPEKKPDVPTTGPTRKRLLELLDIAHDGFTLALEYVNGEDKEALWELRDTIEREAGVTGTVGA